MIHLHRLRLTGPRREYGVNFDLRDSNLAIIAGPSHTGKTSVLELVDYVFGDDDHPDHPELGNSVRSVELELSVNGSVWSIERPLFNPEQVAFIRSGGLDDEGTPTLKPLEPVSDEGSLSTWLLRQIGLVGTHLKVTERNPNSPVNTLSIRDLMWVTYLPSRRLDSDTLLHEGHDQKQFKLRQVIEVLFDIHDDRLAQLLRDQEALVAERRELQREVAALEVFLAEEEVPTPGALGARLAEINSELAKTEADLKQLTDKAAAATDYADKLRLEYSNARRRTTHHAAVLRDRQTLLERLMPLRAQYAEDQVKLTFQIEAERIFDPLNVKRCPGCLRDLDEAVKVVDSHCSLCKRVLESTDDDSFDVKRERRAVQHRIRDLDSYTAAVEEQIAAAHTELGSAEKDERALGAELDDRTRTDLSPFIAQRDALVRRRAELVAERRNSERAVGWQESLERRRNQLEQVETQLKSVRAVLGELRSSKPEKQEVVGELSERFAGLLRDWGFPKVEESGGPFIDERFLPHVRGRPYTKIGSDGAKTLIAVAWFLALFEMAVEHGSPHPGFMMVDMPQKNLAPKHGEEPDEYADPAIVLRMYQHLMGWAGQHPQAQIILVDHEPPESAQHHEVVRYTRRADLSPYGLIDDAVEEDPLAPRP
jgi:hypothetical protein